MSLIKLQMFDDVKFTFDILLWNIISDIARLIKLQTFDDVKFMLDVFMKYNFWYGEIY